MFCYNTHAYVKFGNLRLKTYFAKKKPKLGSVKIQKIIMLPKNEESCYYVTKHYLKAIEINQEILCICPR